MSSPTLQEWIRAIHRWRTNAVGRCFRCLIPVMGGWVGLGKGAEEPLVATTECPMWELADDFRPMTPDERAMYEQALVLASGEDV